MAQPPGRIVEEAVDLEDRPLGRQTARRQAPPERLRAGHANLGLDLLRHGDALI